jgi:hypothetical protein
MNKAQHFDDLFFFFDPVVNKVNAVDKLQVARSFADPATTDRGGLVIGFVITRSMFIT